MQKDRIRDGHQKRTLDEGKEPSLAIGWLGMQHATLETQLKSALGAYAGAQPAGVWAMSVKPSHCEELFILPRQRDPGADKGTSLHGCQRPGLAAAFAPGRRGIIRQRRCR